jgi:protein transport protein SEC31
MKGAAAAAAAGSDITCLSWNRKVQHILGTTTAGGTVVVWDLKKQRPVISFKDPNGRRRCSAVAWNPEVATQLVVASDDDMSPALQLWDLRNSVSPLMELHGHSKGVLAVSWCSQDASLLLSSGKDNRVIVWDVPTGQPHSEMPPAVNWKFDVQWAPGKSLAGVFGGATFEGKVTLDKLATCQAPAADPMTGYQPPRSMKAPAWMKRPVGATFGFGGKLVKFQNSKRQLPTGEVGETATIEVQQVSIDTSSPDISPEFEQVIRSADRDLLRTLCETRAAQSTDPKDAETWSFLQTHFEADGRQHLLANLGFADALPKPEPTQEEEEQQQQAPDQTGLAGPDGVGDGLAALSLEQQAHAAASQAAATHVISGGAAAGQLDDGSGFFAQSPVDASGNFFDNLNTPRDSHAAMSPITNNAGAGGGGSHNAAVQSPKAAEKAEKPIVDGPPGEGEQEIHIALLVGNYQGAVDACVRLGRYADALVAASLVGGDTWDQARKEFMHAHPRPYMRVVHAVLSGDWESFVNARPANAWRETLAALLTSAPYDQFEALVSVLASKLAATGVVHAATLCYVCSGDVEAAVRMWSRVAGGPESSPSSKEAVMEKAVVLGLGVDKAGASSALGDLLARQAEALAANGRLPAAYDLLTLVPGDTSTGAAVLRDRLFRSGGVPQAAMAPPPFPFGEDAAAATATTASTNTYGAAKPVATTYGAPPQQQNMYQNGNASGGYGMNSTPPLASYQQPTAPAQQPAVFQPSQPVSSGYGAPPPTSLAPPPPPPPQQAFIPSAAAPPAPKPTAPPPTVYQHTQQQNTAPSALGMSQHQHMPPPGPSGPSSRGHSAGPPPPTVFQPTAGPPTTAPPAGVPSPAASAFHPSAPPPLAIPSPHPTYTYQQLPSPSGSMAPTPRAPPPTVYQPPQQQQQPQQQPGAQMYGGGVGGMGVMAVPAPMAAAPTPAPRAPPKPPANITITTADISSVAAELRPVATSLVNLYQACESFAGANPAKRRELDDASKKLGALLWKLNEGEISPSVAGKLQQMCAALDMGDFATVGHVQVQLTTSDWDECAAWLTALKRLVKLRQTG